MFDFSIPVNRYGTYCTQWDYVADRFGSDDLLPFTISDMDFAVAPCIQQALATRLDHAVFGYSRWNHADFKEAISGWFQRRYHSDIDSNSIVYGPSVIYIISQLVQLWTDVGDGVLVHTPAYDAFANMLNANQRQLLTSPLLKTEAGSYEIDWPQFEAQAARAECKVLLLCSPQNPTGRVWTRDELVRMAKICQQHSVKVISDDIHMDIAFSDYIPWSQVACDQQWALVSSASKSFNIPALTGAYAVIADTSTRQGYLTQLKAAHGLSSPSILGVIGHIAAYNDGEAWLMSLKDYLHANLEYVADTLNQAFPILNYQVPQGTYLAWIDLNPLKIDMDALQQLLINNYQVAIMRGDTYGIEGSGYVRLNVGCPRSKVEVGVAALIAALQELRVDNL
ncbi:pyridoxal phosphate-dependent aminotransferase [Photobacterium kishitanii]|uniref:MalY/PatB family protein n=1 Tax=Photobacterium kishitanii TaxID=318456 RepID=UPI0005D2F500|nr:MalY/PatB family protein [Photobacterium kishitanii]KJG08854.1 bifunctional beta-cystathionase/maltose regulon regulatory protein [Photobacterium kishitanii]PSV03848.1 pyridoxal phosphate-dependent aminotransferase [Photobacterium kishitanii]PSV18535.1 pyridoxal phosphate-dependent aminotransferase [Photobacterium kishitanii]PSV73922.1 pyridoxal phosphate-dependent aminotransferase [Photobacterium kishitanii]